MSDKIGVLIVHGMGSQEPDFWRPMADELRRRLGGNARRFEWEPVYWANLLREREDQLWGLMRRAEEPAGRPLPLDWVGVRKFVVHNFGDAIAYHRTLQGRDAYRQVHAHISRAIRRLHRRIGGDGTPVVVLAHSLGAHMMSNYVWDRQRRDDDEGLEPLSGLASFVTFGCNIPLFSLAFSRCEPILLPGKSIRKPALRAQSRWLNYFDRDDVLGWPIKPLYEHQRLNARRRATVARIEDHEINVSSLAFNWNPAAHAGYWTDDDLTRPLARHLGRLVAALDA